MAIEELPVNGWRPLSISYSTKPNEKMSERASTCSPFGLLGRHVSRGAHDCARFREGHRLCRANRLRRLRHLSQSKIQQL